MESLEKIMDREISFGERDNVIRPFMTRITLIFVDLTNDSPNFSHMLKMPL